MPAQTAPKTEETTETKPDFAAKLATLAAERNTLVELPDGSVRVTITVPSESVPILKAWAEGAQESWPEYLQRTVELGLDAVINSGAVAG